MLPAWTEGSQGFLGTRVPKPGCDLPVGQEAHDRSQALPGLGRDSWEHRKGPGCLVSCRIPESSKVEETLSIIKSNTNPAPQSAPLNPGPKGSRPS